MSAAGKFCTSCGTRLADSASACPGCGAAQTHACANCGSTNPGGSRFCACCGTAIATEPAAVVPEVLAEDLSSQRREVTVIFVDVTDFTSVSSRLDSEDVYSFIDEALKLLVDVVTDYEGTIDKFTGDGLMAIFGAPVAHENDAERAVRAAWEMQRTIAPFRQRLQTQHGFDLRLRIGVNTGDVVAGRIGGSVHAEYTVIGDTVNLAARLQTAAEPDSVVVSASTHARTAANFRYEPMPPLALKGIPGLVTAYKVAGIMPYIGSKRGVPGIEVPMIGREIPLATLRLTYERALTQGRLTIVCVSGDAGVGKTRLSEEFARVILDPFSMRLISTKCVALTKSRPLSGAGDLLRNLLGLDETDPPQAQAEALRAFMSPLLEHGADDMTAYLASMLGILEEFPEAARSIQALDEAMLQQQTHVAMRMAVLGAAQDQPLVVVVDDLHWLDPASRDLLTYLIQSNPAYPILMLLVTRQLERTTTLRSLFDAAAAHGERFVEIELRPLDRMDARALMRKLLPVDTLQAQNLRNRIVARSQGNPFYLEELVRMLIDRGGLVRSGGNWQVSPEAENLLQDLPSTLRGLILTRADCLPRDLRSVLQKASVLGRSFPVRLLQQLVVDEKIDLPLALQELEHRDFLEEKAFGLERGYTFRHILIQEAMHSTLLRRDRQELHHVAAEAVENGEFWSGAERDEALAYHWGESREPAHALPYLLAAAENAARRHANEAAADHCRKALAILEHAPNGELETRVRLILGRALKFLGHLNDAKLVLHDARTDLFAHLSLAEGTVETTTMYAELLRELADVLAREGSLDQAFKHLEEAWLALTEWDISATALRYSVLERMAWVRFRQGQREDALMRADELVKTLEARDDADPVTLANAYNTLGGVLWQFGKPEASVPYIRRSLGLYHKIGYLFGKAIAHMNLGVLYYAQGKWSEAANNFERSEWLRREIGYMVGRASNLHNLGNLRMSLGDHAGARTDFETSLSIAEQLGEEMERTHSRIGLAQLAVIEGRYDDAQKMLEAVRQMPSLDDEQRVQMKWISALVESHRDLDVAITIAEDAYQQAREKELRELETDCARVAGTLHARSGNFTTAEELLRKSVELARNMGDPYREAQALLELGTVTSRLEVARDGRAMIEEAARLFDELGASYDVKRATAALRVSAA